LALFAACAAWFRGRGEGVAFESNCRFELILDFEHLPRATPFGALQPSVLLFGRWRVVLIFFLSQGAVRFLYYKKSSLQGYILSRWE
jgi:hypothetical protein